MMEAINEMDNFFETEKKKKTFNEYKNKKSEYTLPTISDKRAYGKVGPKDCKEQLSQFAKESE
jgi:hypothetical protein